jgi:hypothetical protein
MVDHVTFRDHSGQPVKTFWERTGLQPAQVVLYQGSGEWSALYVAGQLVQYGDHYLSEEAIQTFYEVETRHSDDFMRGGDGHENVLRTLEEVEKNTIDRLGREERAAALRAQADQLRDEADRIERGEVG